MPKLTRDELVRSEPYQILMNCIEGVDYDETAQILIDLIDKEKKAFAKSVVGRVEDHNEQCRMYRKTMQTSGICICNAKQRNNLRLEILEKIKNASN